MNPEIKRLYNEQLADRDRYIIKRQFFSERKEKLFEEIVCPRKRAMWALHKLGTHSMREIAKVLKCDEKTVRYHIYQIENKKM